MVDFAHTANSFDVILPEVRKTTKGKVIHVFGAAGDRDRGKRPEMGRVASYYDDVIVLTAEDPRGETVTDINSQIKSGISDLGKVHEIEDRNKAIAYAISLADANDTVVITGKGHEQSMNMGHGEVEWSDREAVERLIKK
jgi:UDP-N-acetylmuramoyl-L-alanyl-D-glutamate--2,6-diaminopimelate ligase